MYTLEMLKRIQKFMIYNRAAGTTTAIKTFSKRRKVHILCWNYCEKAQFGKMAVAVMGEDIKKELPILPILIDNGVMVRVLRAAIERIEELEKSNASKHCNLGNPVCKTVLSICCNAIKENWESIHRKISTKKSN